MNSIRIFNQRVGYMVAAAAILLSAILPSLVLAEQVTERSIALSNSSKAMTGVTYEVKFTPDANAGAFVIDFCDESPILGEDCTTPTGFDASTVTTSTVGFTRTVVDANTIRLVGTMTADTEVAVELAGITNPTDAGSIYARVVTYEDDTDAAGYTSTNPDVVGAHIDEGGFAIAITDTVGVSGAVLETMTFCVAKIAITADCANAAANPPVLPLGETVAGTDIVALTPGVVSTGSLYTQISTNAAHGATIRLKSNVACGGLKRMGVATCDIAPALTNGVSDTTAAFGVKTATAAATSGVTSATGTLQPVDGSGYNNATYALNYVGTNLTGVTSTYGDPFLDTDGAPANNQNMELTFAASATNDTPAGLYSADISMIATGKF